MDPESKLVVAVVAGKRTVENTETLVDEFRRRTGGRLMNLMTSDDYPAYETAILKSYGETFTPPRTGRRGRPKAPFLVPPSGLTYATVTKRRAKGCMVEIGTRVVFGTADGVRAALGRSRASRAINTSFVERENGTDRHRNARKARKTYRFSKKWGHHESVTYLSMYFYNFCWPVRTLARADDRGRVRKRTPAMAAGLSDHVWPMSEWLSRPALQQS